MIKEVVFADLRLDMVSQMTLSGDTYGAELYRSLRRTMEEWEGLIPRGTPGKEVPREMWEPVLVKAEEIAKKIDASGRLTPVLK